MSHQCVNGQPSGDIARQVGDSNASTAGSLPIPAVSNLQPPAQPVHQKQAAAKEPFRKRDRVPSRDRSVRKVNQKQVSFTLQSAIQPEFSMAPVAKKHARAPSRSRSPAEKPHHHQACCDEVIKLHNKIDRIRSDFEQARVARANIEHLTGLIERNKAKLSTHEERLLKELEINED